MKFTILILLFLSCVIEAKPQGAFQNLPTGAVVLESKNIPKSIRANRVLVLWMKYPENHQNKIPSDEMYTCPDYTRGSYYSGPTKVTLINTATGKILNTVDIDAVDGENLDLPFAIRRGYYYRVAPTTKSGVEGRPTIMWLDDYNGDGLALEFALFNAQACMGLDTTLIGYSKKQDRVIHYPIALRTSEGNQTTLGTVYWADYLFSKKTQRAGFWKYDVDYRGRGGTLDHWTVSYDRTKEQFAAIVVHEADSDGFVSKVLGGVPLRTQCL